MPIASKWTEVSDSETREAMKEWVLERVRHETSMFRDALRLFVPLTFVANATAAISVGPTILSCNSSANGLAIVSISFYFFGLLSGLVFGLTLMSSLNVCRQKYLLEAPRLYFAGELTDFEFAAFHKETHRQRAAMVASAILAVSAFVVGSVFAVICLAASRI